MHICTAIETGDQHYNRSYGMSCLKYDIVMGLYRIYIAFSYATNRILQVLEEEEPEIVLLDELDKLLRNFAEDCSTF
jgi:hypothetical protein